MLGEVLQVEGKVIACGNFNWWEKIRGTRKEIHKVIRRMINRSPYSISNVAFRFIETSGCRKKNSEGQIGV